MPLQNTTCGTLALRKMKRIRRFGAKTENCGSPALGTDRTDVTTGPPRFHPRLLLLAVLIFRQQDVGDALLPSATIRNTGPGWREASGRGVLSPLFFSTTRRLELERRRQHISSTALPMVLTTPESIIEQASTVNLLDDLIDESVRTSPRRPIMMQFDPSSGWIWRRWKGTIFSETWTSCVKNMIYASLIFLLYKKYPGVKEHLNGFGTLWGQLLSVTTFTLTFFVNQSYALWRKCYELSRRLQGRLHDIGMNLATHATRKVPTTPEETSTYTASSRQILELMSRYIRLFDLLTYASFTRSHRPILTPRGMRRLVERGLMTPQERQVLVDAGIPATQRHSAILMWMIRLFIEGRQSGHILGGDGFEQQTMEKFHIIRAQYGAIGDELQGRMPLAYAHVVQILVDLILWMYPIMAFSIGMSPVVAIAGTGLLTISYQGLFDLAKQFLDPYDNENYGKGEDPLSVDTLIAETNAGSVRWMYGFEEMPFSQDKIKDGELYDYLLPVRGYTVEELAQMEEEKIQREKEAEEQRVREEQERLKQEEMEEKQALSEDDDDDDDPIEDVETNDINGMEGPNGDSLTNFTITEELLTPPVEEEPPVHKVFTLADGTVVSFKEEPEIITQPPESITGKGTKSENGKNLAPSLAASYLASLTRDDDEVETTVSAVGVDDESTVSQLENLETASENSLETQDLLVMNDTSMGNQESHATEPVADDEYEGVEEVVATRLDREEFESKISAATKDEQIKVVDSTGITDALPASSIKEKRKADIVENVAQQETMTPVTEALASTTVTTPTSTLIDAQDIAQGPRSDASLDVHEESVTPLDDLPPRKPTRSGKQKSDNDNDEMIDMNEGKPSAKAINDDTTEDPEEGKEEPPSRMTLEDYNKQVEAIMETAKEELLETEAILNARPGYDPVGWDYDDELLAASTDGTEEEEEEEEEMVEEVDEKDLVILEMDKPDEGEFLDIQEAEEDAEPPEDVVIDTNTDIDAIKLPLEADEEITENIEDVNVTIEDEQTPQASDKVEPIMIEDEDVLAEDEATSDLLIKDPSTETDKSIREDDNTEEEDGDSEYRL